MAVESRKQHNVNDGSWPIDACREGLLSTDSVEKVDLPKLPDH